MMKFVKYVCCVLSLFLLLQFFNSSEGYGNPLSFQLINPTTIKDIESKIQRNGIAIERELDKSMDMDCEVNDDNLIEIFGEKFANNPSQFRFRDGDIILIQELVVRVKQMVDNNELFRFKHESKRKKSKRTNIQSHRTMHGKNVPINNERFKMLKELLFEKVKVCFEQYTIDEYVELGFHDMFEDRSIVDVQVCQKNKIEQIYGTIVCLICREQNGKAKRLRVYYRDGDESSSFWVMSNYTKHLTRTHHLTPIHTKKQNVKTESDCVVIEDDSIENIKVEDVDLKIYNESWLYTQLAAQITEMIQAVLSNGEKEDRMAIKLNDKDTAYLTVASIPNDGNCLFSSIAHQLYRHPINSKDHIDATKELRAQVIEHILDPDNFPSYQFTLQDRVYEMKTADQIQNMTTECKLYVRHVLSKDGKWGGHESISAIAEIHKLNIMTFNEEGTCILLTNPNEKYDRTIAIAYRIGMKENGQVVRNHYESVCDMNSNDLLAATDLAMKRIK